MGWSIVLEVDLNNLQYYETAVVLVDWDVLECLYSPFQVHITTHSFIDVIASKIPSIPLILPSGGGVPTWVSVS